MIDSSRAVRDAHRADLPAVDRSERGTLTTKVSIRKRVPPAPPGDGLRLRRRRRRDLGTLRRCQPRSARDAASRWNSILPAVEDGAHGDRSRECSTATTSLGTANLGVFVIKGLDAKLKSARDRSGRDSRRLRPRDVLFPATTSRT